MLQFLDCSLAVLLAPQPSLGLLVCAGPLLPSLPPNLFFTWSRPVPRVLSHHQPGGTI